MVPVKISSSASPIKQLKHGHVVVGVTIVQVIPQHGYFEHSIVLRNLDTTDSIWIGRFGVTADSDVTTGGFPLAPGAVLEIPIDDASQLYAIAAVAGKDLAWMGV